ncbi:GntR family transcriptional regulator [Prosthecomicrobium sp. N25]|uniref:GntR family transcriptional regulator n=1 Tax=Prosthecomicrobium sp. N25 TaxID=3129254 RepID=UPI003078640F
MSAIDGDAAAKAQSQDRGQQIRQGIVTAILEHRLHPGTKLGEDEIGAIYGASRTIVRSALQALAHEGIVVIEKNRGAFVARPTPAEAREVFEARRLIEPAVAMRAAERFTGDWSRLLALHLAEERKALAEGDDRAAIRLSGEFHGLVARLAQHGIYADILAELITRSSLIILLYRSRRAHFCGTDHHEAIAAAIAERDGPAAARLMVEHLDEIEQGLDLVEPERPDTRLADILGG